MSVITNIERIADMQAAIKLAIQGELKKVWSSMPAIVQQQSDGHTAQAQISINGQQVMIDGQITQVPISMHLDLPIHFPGGGGHTFTHPVQQGDEGLAVYTSRPQDVWHQNGGTNNNPIDDRMHSLSDGRWLPGGRSDPRKLSPAASQTSSQQRSDDGNHVVDVNQSSGVTHASTKKVISTVAGSATTLHVPGTIFKNAAKVLINSVSGGALPAPGVTIANRKQVATTPFSILSLMSGNGASGGIGSILSSVLSGGIGSVMSDPTAAANSTLASTITSAAASLSGVPGASALIAGLGGLQSGLSTFGSYTSDLSGASMPSEGQLGLSDLMTFAQNVTAYFGNNPPPAVSPLIVTAPIEASPTLQSMNVQVNSVTAQVIAGTMTPAAALVLVEAMTAALASLVSASQAAIAALQNAEGALSSIMTAASGAGSQNPAEARIVGLLSGANFQTLVNAAQGLMETPAEASSFPDPASAQPGATGGL